MMILLRVVLVLGMAYLVWKAWQMLRGPKPPVPQAEYQAMVPCKVCGVHIPKTNAHAQDGAYFCSEHAPKD